MVNHLNPRPVVYDFCKHYFAHCYTGFSQVNTVFVFPKLFIDYIDIIL